METIRAELELDKRDGRGRRLEKPERWGELIGLYEKSGLTQRAFARKEGISYATFVAWLGRKRRGQMPRPTSPVRFEQLRLGGPPAMMAPLEVVLPNGIVLRGGDAAALVTLVKALAS